LMTWWLRYLRILEMLKRILRPLKHSSKWRHRFLEVLIILQKKVVFLWKIVSIRFEEKIHGLVKSKKSKS
jgi:hypothetical protein